MTPDEPAWAFMRVFLAPKKGEAMALRENNARKTMLKRAKWF